MKKVISSLALMIIGILVLTQSVLAYPGENKKVFFIHHSTGAIYWEGQNNKGLKYYLEKNDFEANDVDYWDGGTDPQDFYDLFSSEASWGIIGDSDIVLFKSCFPASGIDSNHTLKQYKQYYRGLYEVFLAHSDVLFVPMSTPPLPKQMTTKAQATRAMKFDKWLTHRFLTDYTGNNLAPFRLHQLLRTKKGYLQKKYVLDPQDGHPKKKSGNVLGKAMIKHLNKTLIKYQAQ
ncbi:MAG: hypothetical protein V1898_04690 [Patescibacteria group bacterium]